MLNDKQDQEELCGLTEPCVLPFQILLDNPLQFFQAEIRIRGINNHSPVFPDKEIILKISESTTPRTTFQIACALDLDVGINSFQVIQSAPIPTSILNYKTVPRAQYYHKPVLDKALDREEQPEIRLTLTALDGEIPPRSGTDAH